MRLPDQLADIAHELARRGRTRADPASYADGVRDTLVFVGEMMQLAASTLPTSASELAVLGDQPTSAATRLRHLGSELHVLITASPDEDEPAPPTGPRPFADLLRAHALVMRAASRLDPTPPATSGGVEHVDAPPDTGGAQGNGTWLAAFVLAVVGQRTVDEQDVVDVLRLADYDAGVLQAAVDRVDRTVGIDDTARTAGRDLLLRAAAAAGDLRPAEQGAGG